MNEKLVGVITGSVFGYLSTSYFREYFPELSSFSLYLGLAATGFSIGYILGSKSWEKLNEDGESVY